MEASGRAYTEALSELYPTRADVAAEIAELEGRLTLPRSTELVRLGHPRRVQRLLPCAARWLQAPVRALIEEVFGSTLNDDEKAALLALACYPANIAPTPWSTSKTPTHGLPKPPRAWPKSPVGRQRPHHRRGARASA